MTDKQEIKKTGKYIIQFPEDTANDAKEEYMRNLDETLKNEQFAVVDSKIKVYQVATEKQEAPKASEEPTPTETPKADTEQATETPKEDKTEPASEEQATGDNPTATEESTVKKVTVTSEAPPKEEPNKTVFDSKENASSGE